jgi:hypothetical protein
MRFAIDVQCGELIADVIVVDVLLGHLAVLRVHATAKRLVEKNWVHVVVEFRRDCFVRPNSGLQII